LAARSDPRRETQVAWRVKRYFTKAGYSVRGEVPFMSKRIDLVGVSPRTGQVIAVEAKVQDWRRGLQQALTYRLCSDEAFLAISTQYLQRVDRLVLAKYGIGLIAVDGVARVEMPARTSSVRYLAYLDLMRKLVLREDQAKNVP
jgi:hypothetical protein